MVKYSKNFERDYNWYLKYKDHFTFSGSNFDNRLIVEDRVNGKPAKECFYKRDSTGEIIPTNEPDLLKQIYICKESINFHIKEWSFGIKEYTFKIDGFIEEYELLDWMIGAINKTTSKLEKSNVPWL